MSETQPYVNPENTTSDSMSTQPTSEPESVEAILDRYTFEDETAYSMPLRESLEVALEERLAEAYKKGFVDGGLNGGTK
jgi:hypothetical protein